MREKKNLKKINFFHFLLLKVFSLSLRNHKKKLRKTFAHLKLFHKKFPCFT